VNKLAEFGIKATELSSPQGAGSSPVSPVQVDDTGWMKTVGEGLNIFAKGLGIKEKEEAGKQESNIINSYSRKLSEINSALSTGQITAAEAGMRSRAISNEYMGGYGELAEKLSKVSKAFAGATELGTAEKEIETAATLYNKALTDTQSAGYPIYDWMTKTQKDSAIRAYQTGVQADKEFTRLTAKTAEDRASGKYNQDVSDREKKDFSIRLIGDIVGTNFEASYDQVNSLSAGISSGKITPEEAQMEWARKMGRINSQIQLVSGTNPELAAPYRSLFATLESLGKDMLDPTKASDKLKSEIDLLQNQAKLLILQQPGAANVIAASQLFGQNAQVALGSSPTVAKVITNIISTPVESPSAKEQVIGNPEVQKDTFKFLSKSLKDLNAGKFKDNVKANEEATNGVNNILQQVGDSLGRRGVTATYLKDSASFFASPEFGQYVTTAKIDNEALAGATKTFQVQYQNEVITGVDKEVQRVFTTIDKFGSKSALDLAAEAKAKGGPIKETSVQKQTEVEFDVSKVVPTFTGAGVAFSYVNPSSNPATARQEREILNQLKMSQTALTQLVHIGAHMEGTTNYSKFWEENKHVILPRFFSKYEGLEIGQVVDGKRYVGGDANDPSNWK